MHCGEGREEEGRDKGVEGKGFLHSLGGVNGGRGGGGEGDMVPVTWYELSLERQADGRGHAGSPSFIRLLHRQ